MTSVVLTWPKNTSLRKKKCAHNTCLFWGVFFPVQMYQAECRSDDIFLPAKNLIWKSRENKNIFHAAVSVCRIFCVLSASCLMPDAKLQTFSAFSIDSFFSPQSFGVVSGCSWCSWSFVADHPPPTHIRPKWTVPTLWLLLCLSATLPTHRAQEGFQVYTQNVRRSKFSPLLTSEAAKFFISKMFALSKCLHRIAHRDRTDTRTNAGSVHQRDALQFHSAQVCSILFYLSLAYAQEPNWTIWSSFLWWCVCSHNHPRTLISVGAGSVHDDAGRVTYESCSAFSCAA